MKRIKYLQYSFKTAPAHLNARKKLPQSNKINSNYFRSFYDIQQASIIWASLHRIKQFRWKSTCFLNFFKISTLSSNYFITSTPNNAKILTITPDYCVNWTWSQITNELFAIWLKMFCFKITSKRTSIKFTYSHRHTYDHKAGKALLPFCLNILHILQSVKNNKHIWEKFISCSLH